MRKLPTFKGYTVDSRLREFRKVGNRGVESIPFVTVSGQKLLREMKQRGRDKFIGVWTLGMMRESSETREAVEREFNRLARELDDWFYVVVVEGTEFFVADNGEFGYTAMLPDEY